MRKEWAWLFDAKTDGKCDLSITVSVQIDKNRNLTWCHSERSKARASRPNVLSLVSFFNGKDILSDEHNNCVILFWEVARSVFGSNVVKAMR